MQTILEQLDDLRTVPAVQKKRVPQCYRYYQMIIIGIETLWKIQYSGVK
jgi:hypothetical protein